MSATPVTPRRLRLRASALLIPALLAWSGWRVLRPSPGPDTGMPDVPRSARPTPRTTSGTAVENIPVWPEGRLEGGPAKRLLLAALTAAADRLHRSESYTATLRKRERIGGTLGPEETMEVKVRHRPFAVYLKYRGGKEGREVVYAEGENEGKLVAHTADWTRHLVPRLVLHPTSPLAMADNRHPITEAGLAHLAGKLLAACRLDLDDAGAITVLDRLVEGGRPWLRSVQTYARRTAERPLARVEVCYDAETGLPLRFSGYEWPGPGRADESLLGESYRYDDLRLDAGLTGSDFDPDNPAYAFVRPDLPDAREPLGLQGSR